MKKRGGGCTASFGVVLTQELRVLAIVEGLVINFHPIKRGARKGFTLSWEGGGQVSRNPQFFHFV